MLQEPAFTRHLIQRDPSNDPSNDPPNIRRQDLSNITPRHFSSKIAGRTGEAGALSTASVNELIGWLDDDFQQSRPSSPRYSSLTPQHHPSTSFETLHQGHLSPLPRHSTGPLPLLPSFLCPGVRQPPQHLHHSGPLPRRPPIVDPAIPVLGLFWWNLLLLEAQVRLSSLCCQDRSWRFA